MSIVINSKRSTSRIQPYFSYHASSTSLSLEFSASALLIENPSTLMVSSMPSSMTDNPLASLVICLLALGAFSTYVLLAPAQSISLILDIVDFSFRFRIQLLLIAVINILTCFAFERFAERPIARLISHFKRYMRARKGRRGRKHGALHQYKVIEGNMR